MTVPPVEPAPPGSTPLRTTSLRRRVTVLAVAVLAIVLLGVVIAVDRAFAAETNRDLAAVLVDHERLAQQLAASRAQPATIIAKVESDGVRARLVLADGEVYGSLTPLRPTARPPRTATVTLRGGRVAGATLTLSLDSSVVDNAIAQLRRTLLLVGLVALAVAAVALVVSVRLALAPLGTMADLARSIARGDRGRRLAPTRADTELGRAAEAFDDMLDALEGAERQARVAEAASRAAEAVARNAEAAARNAEAASRASEERTKLFVADAAHELRTPIAGVQAAAEAVLQQSPDAPTEDRDRLHLLLVRESRRAGQLVNDLLDLARIDAGVAPNRARVDLRDVAESQADRIRLLTPELTVEVTGPALTVPADAGMITQIVANLLDNARHATPRGGRVDVTLEPLAGGGFASLVVADSGEGVPEADRERIFGRLVRLDSARDRRSGGSGLGLPIARGFARAHGGDLTCEPPGPDRRGAVFRLVLPTTDDPAALTVRLPATPGPERTLPAPPAWPDPGWPTGTTDPGDGHPSDRFLGRSSG